MSYSFDRSDHDGVELGKALLRKQFALDHQAKHGGSFSRAWDKVLENHPDLAESREELTPTDQPAFAAEKASEKTSWDDVLALMKKYAKQRVEAAPESDDEPPSKVGAIKVYGGAHPFF